MSINNLIESIKLPKTNDYYEKSSADGYALLGYALKKINSNRDLLDEVVNRNFSLNSNYNIRNIKVSKDNQYIYTIWLCLEYILLLDQDQIANNLYQRVLDIGIYSNGMARYCVEETYYIVPNVTSAMALIHCQFNNFEESKKLINVLRETQYKNNWCYYDIKGKNYIKLKKFEDKYHQCMIIYHLQEIKKYDKIYVDDIIDRTIKPYMKYKKIADIKDIGKGLPWFYPMFTLIIEDYNNTLFEQGVNLLKKKYIKHNNFRVRAFSAWVLSKLY